MRKTIMYFNLLLPFFLCSGQKSSEVKEMIESVNENVKETVILVHGLIRTKASMMLLGHYLKKNDYNVVYYSYYSTRHKLDCHSERFADFIAKFAKKNPKTKINIVTHSMGGILAREAIEKISNDVGASPCGCPDKEECVTSNIQHRTSNKINFGRIVMIAPPNKGSKAATVFGSGWLIPKFIKPLPELRNAQDSRINSVPLIKDLEVGIISGRYDSKVRPEEAQLEGEKEHMVVNSFHTFIMNRKHVKQAVVNFLKKGSFEK